MKCGARQAGPTFGLRVWERDHRALEALHNTEVASSSDSSCEGGGDLLVAVERTAVVRIVRRERGGVARERERVDQPEAAVVAGVSRRGGGDVQLKPAEVVDGVEAMGGRAC